ncbi:K(+)-transporting ATPase subunit F [Streptomyces boninensis]
MTAERVTGLIIAACLVGYLLLARKFPGKF